MLSHSLYKVPVLLLLVAPLSAFAGVSISEVMYDVPGADTGREWIEFQNTDSLPVDIAGWKLYEAEVNHKIIAQNGTVVLPSGYAVIASDTKKFLEDWPQYSGLLFRSSFSLKNTGETLVLKNASSSEMTFATYGGGSAEGDGNSLNALTSGWSARKPSPGGPASNEAIQVPKPVPKVGNAQGSSGVPTSDGAAYDGAVAIRESQALASAISAEKGNSHSFAMLPWIVALLAIVGIAGFAIFLKDKKPKTSGYKIIEEK